VIGLAACVVWWSPEGLRCQGFASLVEAELFVSSCDTWAVLVSGTADDFSAGCGVRGDYLPEVFGGVA